MPRGQEGTRLDILHALNGKKIANDGSFFFHGRTSFCSNYYTPARAASVMFPLKKGSFNVRYFGLLFVGRLNTEAQGTAL